jgi:hypothetical protein
MLYTKSGILYTEYSVFYTLNTLSLHSVFFKENINTSIFKESRNLPLVRFYNFLQSIVPDLLL